MASLSLLLECSLLGFGCSLLGFGCSLFWLFGMLAAWLWDVRCLGLGCSLLRSWMFVAHVFREFARLSDRCCPRLLKICPALRRSLPWASSP
ncbi:hypothetical protein [Bacteroides reticulotermitis]|uniref:hypothetical protein n=1 Tax=Bacteroides reticulotermitis TaxID=1133319 RepID=UPI003A87486E